MHGIDNIDQLIDIERILAILTSKQRDAVILAIIGHTRADIARIKKVTPSSVTKLLQNAAKRLTIRGVRGL